MFPSVKINFKPESVVKHGKGHYIKGSLCTVFLIMWCLA